MAIVVGEQNIKSLKTDASLYNGQPTDTGTQYYNNVGITSSTPSIQKDKNGVSIEIVELFRGCLVAMTYIPKESMRKSEK